MSSVPVRSDACSPHHSLTRSGRAGTWHPHFTDGETEARGPGPSFGNFMLQEAGGLTRSASKHVAPVAGGTEQSVEDVAVAVALDGSLADPCLPCPTFQPGPGAVTSLPGDGSGADLTGVRPTPSHRTRASEGPASVQSCCHRLEILSPLSWSCVCRWRPLRRGSTSRMAAM